MSEPVVSTVWQPQHGPHPCAICGAAHHKWTIIHDGETFCENCDPWEAERRAKKDVSLTEIAHKAFLAWSTDTHMVSEEAADEIWNEYAETRERWRRVVELVLEEGRKWV